MAPCGNSRFSHGRAEWSGPETLQTVYQQADQDTMYEVVMGGGDLREASDR